MSSEEVPNQDRNRNSGGPDPLEPPVVSSPHNPAANQMPPGWPAIYQPANYRPASYQPTSNRPANPGAVPPPPLRDALKQLWQAVRGALQEKTYGAPRVFDLFTLMSITLAFGLLFAAMKALDAVPEVFVSITSFVTLVALAQMLLYQGNSPRLASIVGGPIALLLIGIGLAIWFARARIIFGMLCLLPIGVPFGYLAGGLIAGVFLVADELRAKFKRPAEPVSEEDIWR